MLSVRVPGLGVTAAASYGNSLMEKHWRPVKLTQAHEPLSPETQAEHDRDELRYPSDLTDAEWQILGHRCHRRPRLAGIDPGRCAK